MSARDEILKTLRDNPRGLTTKELAPLCPAADLDPFIVARVIAQLRTEKIVASSPAGPREGHVVFILNSQDAQTSERPHQSTAVPTTTEPKESNMTISAKIIEAIQRHGPMTVPQLAEHVRSENLGALCYSLVHSKKLAVDKRPGRGLFIYSLPGAAPERSPRTSPSSPRERTPRPAPTPANGAADFAITSHGLLSIQKGDQVVQLDPTEYAALRAFTDRAEAIWKETI